MATINVRRDVQDSFYRYKMPRIQAKVKKKNLFLSFLFTMTRSKVKVMVLKLLLSIWLILLVPYLVLLHVSKKV